MKKILKLAVICAAIVSLSVTSYAASSKEGGSGGGSGSGGGGTWVEHDNTEQGYENSMGPMKGKVQTSGTWSPIHTYPRTDADPSYPGNEVMATWSHNDIWQWFLQHANYFYNSEWVNAVNPYANNAVQTFYFGEDNVMLTGWHWIPAKDGMLHCYYFQETSDGSRGQLLRNATTPDGYQVNGNGEWIVEGVVQTRAIPKK